MADAIAKLTPEQRTWVKKLGTLIAPSGGKDEGTRPDKATDQNQKKGVAADGKKELVGIGPGDIIPIIKGLLSNISVKGTIENNTGKDLELIPSSIKFESGKFRTEPPKKILAGRKGKFLAVNKFPNTAGASGEMLYAIGDLKTNWRVKWNNPRIGDNTSESNVIGPKADEFDADSDPQQGEEVEFSYTLEHPGGPSPKPGPSPGPGPSPQPGPGPSTDVGSSCSITVNNNTKLLLTLADQGHDRGDFMTFPPASIQPGGSAQFVSVETPHAKEEGCKGFVSWEVGSPAAAILRCEWDNPEAEKNTAKASAEPQSAGFRTIAQIGQNDENVPVVFTISGGGDGPAPNPSPGPSPSPSPSPQPGPSPEPEPDFNAPPGSRQPTLRKGDKSPDGWVEYLQRQLNLFLGANTVQVDGNFGPKTLNAVLSLQRKLKLQADGTVGNQTWAALRSGAPEAPSTDGRQPHTFEEKGLQARWDVEKNDAVYEKSSDTLFIFAANVGEGQIDDFFATVRITPPNTKARTVKIKIGPPDTRTATGQGERHAVKILQFKKTFPATDPNAAMGDYLVEAFFDSQLGPDVFRGKVVEV